MAGSTEFIGLPPTCELRGWLVFGPGYHKDELYSLDRCRQMGRNFARLSTGASPYLVPRLKIGHDNGQRLATSLGFPSFGRVPRLEVGPDGQLRVWVDQVPTPLGAAINAGLFRSGSVEIPPPMPDPDRPAQKIDGPVLTAVSLLGEEQPAVKGYPPPKAVFADGTPVPPAKDLTPWLTAMAEVARAFSAEWKPRARYCRERGTAVLCFSDYMEIPVTPEQIIEALKALTPDQIKMVSDACQQMAAPPAAPPADAGAQMNDADPNAAPMDPNDMGGQYAALCKRMADMEAAVSGMQDKDQQKDAAMFSDMVTREVDSAIKRGAIDRRDRDTFIAAGKSQDRTKKFSDGDHKGKTAADVWLAGVASRQGSSLYREEPDPAPSDDGINDPFVRRALNARPLGRQILADAAK